MSDSRSRRPPAPVTVATTPLPSGEEGVDVEDTPVNTTDTPAAPTLHGKEGTPCNLEVLLNLHPINSCRIFYLAFYIVLVFYFIAELYLCCILYLAELCILLSISIHSFIFLQNSIPEAFYILQNCVSCFIYPFIVLFSCRILYMLHSISCRIVYRGFYVISLFYSLAILYTCFILYPAKFYACKSVYDSFCISFSTVLNSVMLIYYFMLYFFCRLQLQERKEAKTSGNYELGLPEA
jgi:hypothetical protein